MKKSKPRFQLVFKGNSFAEAEKAGLKFWQDCSAEVKLVAMNELLEQEAILKGLNDQ
mgnify:CR=1 FL=1